MFVRKAVCLLLPALACFATVPGTATARAADVVVLRSGFSVTCESHQQITPDTLRLYLRPLSDANTSYMDVSVSSVVSIEAEAEPVKISGQTPAVAVVAAPIQSLLQRSGAAHNVNAALLASVVHAESSGNPRAVSPTGARGLMQLMPATAAQLGVRDSFEPAANVEGGSAYLDMLLTRYHDNIALALAAYNAGPAAVDRYHGVPPFRETRLYVARVVREFNRLVKADAAHASSVTASVLPGPAR